MSLASLAVRRLCSQTSVSETPADCVVSYWEKALSESTRDLIVSIQDR